MSFAKITNTTPSIPVYSLKQFSAEWQSLSKKISVLAEKIIAQPVNSKMAFEYELDSLNFEQMNLVSRVKTLPEKERCQADLTIKITESSLTKLDDLMYEPTISRREELRKTIIGGLFAGMLGKTVGNIVKHVSTTMGSAVNHTVTPAPEMESYAAYQNRLMSNLLGCRHNGEETSVMDIIEHIFNGEYGSAARDVAESDIVHDIIDTIGNEIMKIED